MSEQLEKLITTLAVLRMDEEIYDARRRLMLEDFVNSLEYKTAEDASKTATQEVEKCTNAVHAEALTMWEANDDKHPHPKVEIKMFLRTSITDSEVARNWCFDNLRAALKLDTKTVEKYAKQFGVVPGVDVEELPKVYIASKLD